MPANRNLQRAKAEKNDEFYTQLTDIEKELKHYKHHFRNKIIFCNCDDPEHSNFWKYFELNFEHLGLKKLIATHYHKMHPTYKLELIKDENNDGKVDSKDIIKTPLKQNGDFRSPECMEILKEADIICTNPPFSLYKEYISTLMEHNKDFLIIGNYNALTYKETFVYIKDNKMWAGISPRSMVFQMPSGELKNINAKWFTNLDISIRHEELILYKSYKGNEDKYPKYVNYDAIEVGKTSNIPIDYDGEMGVPITFLDKYNPDQFEIIGTSLELANSMSGFAAKGEYVAGGPRFYIKELNGEYLYKRMFDRVVIKKKVKGSESE